MCEKVDYNNTSREYVFVIDIDNDMYIKNHWPIRLKVQNSG